MPAKRLLTILTGTLLVLFGIVVGSTPARAASQYKVIHAFNSKEAGYPHGGVVADAAGNLYGTASGGLVHDDYGTVFELTPGANGRWTEKVIHVFKDDANGFDPRQRLTIDAAGNLYGTTTAGGDSTGTAFELTPVADGNWTFKLLYTFSGGEHCLCSVMTLDAAGNLYGTTSGDYGCCAEVFELSRGENGEWTESALFNFFGAKAGLKPSGGLIFDAAGNLYGTTSQGGHGSDDCNASSCGVVFELSPGANGQWTETLLHSFKPGDGGSGPASGLIFDAAGNLYGSTDYGGKGCAPYGCGTIFKLTPAANGKWTHRPLHSFRTETDGVSKLVFDNAGNLYGTTYQGGKNGAGTIFKLTPSANRAWTLSVVHTFNSNNKGGYLPDGGLTFDAASGNFYGTAAQGGLGDCNSCGVVFEITP